MVKPLSFYFAALSLIIFPLCVCVSLLYQHSRLEDQLRTIEAEQSEFHAYIEDNLKEVYMLYSQNASHTRTIMNMTVRNYHHIAGHSETTSFCPECYDIVRRKGEAIPPKPKE
jgi:hypothetical protein